MADRISTTTTASTHQSSSTSTSTSTSTTTTSTSTSTSTTPPPPAKEPSSGPTTAAAATPGAWGKNANNSAILLRNPQPQQQPAAAVVVVGATESSSPSAVFHHSDTDNNNQTISTRSAAAAAVVVVAPANPPPPKPLPPQEWKNIVMNNNNNTIPTNTSSTTSTTYTNSTVIEPSPTSRKAALPNTSTIGTPTAAGAAAATPTTVTTDESPQKQLSSERANAIHTINSTPATPQPYRRAVSSGPCSSSNPHYFTNNNNNSNNNTNNSNSSSHIPWTTGGTTNPNATHAAGAAWRGSTTGESEPPLAAPHTNNTNNASSGYTSNNNNGGSSGYYGLPLYGHTNYGQDTSRVNTVDPDLVDSALLAALADVRERAAVLTLEAALIQFAQSSQGWIEVGGPYNSILVSSPASAAAALAASTSSPPPSYNNTSTNATNNGMAQQQQQHQAPRQSTFQRCILHRLADRFGLVREPGALLGSASLRLIKVPASAVPVLLLADYCQNHGKNQNNWANKDLSDEDHHLSTALSNQASLGLTTLTDDPPIAPQKMKIMKRSTSQPIKGDTSNNSQTVNNVNKKTAASVLEEKEKAYALARARIFNQESQTSGSGSLPEEAESSAAVDMEDDGTAAAVLTAGSRTTSLCSLPHMISDPTSTSFAYAATPAASTIQQQQQQKAVYRNRSQEEADPDFRRNKHRTNHTVPYHQPLHHHPISAAPQHVHLLAGADAIGYQPWMGFAPQQPQTLTTPTAAQSAMIYPPGPGQLHHSYSSPVPLSFQQQQMQLHQHRQQQQQYFAEPNHYVQAIFSQPTPPSTGTVTNTNTQRLQAEAPAFVPGRSRGT